MNENTVVLKGSGTGVRIRLPKAGSIVTVNKGKLTNVPKATNIRLAA